MFDATNLLTLHQTKKYFGKFFTFVLYFYERKYNMNIKKYYI